MKSRLFFIGWLFASLFHVLAFSQPRFDSDSRLTDIIVYVKPTVLQLPEMQSEVLPQQAVINVPELAQFISQRNVQTILRSFPHADPADTIIVNEFGHRITLIDRTRVFRFRFPLGTHLEELVGELNKLPGIIFAYIPPLYELDTTPNDYWFPRRQWYFRHTGQFDQPPVTASGRADIRAVEAWSIFKGSSSMKIGIMDTGVRLNHPDLSGKVVGDNWTGNSHGTHVAGIAGARSNNTEGIAGLDWHATIVSRNLGNWEPEVIYDKIISALNSGVHVLNNSWSGVQGSNPADLLSRLAFVTAYKMNVTAVATMGNTGIVQTRYPGAWPHVIAIGSTNHTNERSGFSTRGDHIDVAAPGGWGDPQVDNRNIWSTWGSPNYQYERGTSMAAPQVTALSSLLRGYAQEVLGRTLFTDDIRWIIRLSTDKVGSHSYVNGWNNRLGYGRINAKKALDRLNPNLYTLTHSFVVGGTSQGASSGYWMSIYGAQALGLQDGNYWVRRHEVRRTISYSSTAGVAVWCRGTVTNGWANEPEENGIYSNFTYGFCEPVPGTVTNTSATLRTYIYEVFYYPGGQSLGYYPTPQNNVRYEYTVHGLAPPPPPYITLDATGIHPKLDWNQVDGADSYDIYRGTVQGPDLEVNCSLPDYFKIGSTTLTTYTDGTVFIDPNSDILVCYYAKSINQAGASGLSNIVNLRGMAPLRLDELISAETIALPMEYAIHDNYPNPFNPSTTIRYEIPEASRVSLVVYDIMGREVQRLVDEVIEPGYYTATWEGRNKSGSPVASGIYIYRFTALPVSDAGISEGIHYVKTMLFTK
jgi:subtilisin family serine protease